MKKLRDANALPEIKWVEVQSKLEQAENAAAIAAREVSDAAIYAPAAGIVSKKFAEVGQNVAPGIPVFSIVSVDDIKVSIPVPGDEIGGIVEGDKAKVSFDALGGATVDGVVTQKGVVADPLTRAYDVKIAISGQDGKVLPGMTCGVVLKKPEMSPESHCRRRRCSSVRTIVILCGLCATEKPSAVLSLPAAWLPEAYMSPTEFRRATA